jgi:phage terminase large subunit
MEILLSNTFYPLLEDRHRYLVLCGGRGSGKSEFAARKIFYRAQVEGDHRFLILRKVRKTCGVSVIKVFQRLLSENAIDYNYNKSDHVIMWQAPNGTANELLFDGLDEPEKIKSIKGITSMWIEEATEFTEKEFVEVDLCLREPGPLYKQIIMSFNPDEALAPWLKKRFFDSIDPDAFVHVSTIEDNPIAVMREEYRKQLALLTDETRRKIYLFGVWAALKGRIYDWDSQLPPAHVDETWYGGDFGYSVNPATLIKIYRKADEYWLEEIFYEAGLTNQDIGNKMITDPNTDIRLPSYWDSAEMKSIEELYRLGINALPALKGPDSVRSGIDLLKAQKIHIVPGSMNLIREASRYNWREDKNGLPLPEPVKFDDHALDATRYGIFTHMRGSQEAGIFFSKESVYI